MDSLRACRHFPSFPVPAEGETLFSLFTRCKATSGFPADAIVQDLTGQRLKSRLLAALPAYLPTMAANLHKKHPFSDPLNVIRQHSMFPYLAYFMPASKRAEFEAKVASTDVTQPIGLGMGLSKYPVNIMAAPRFCPACIEEGINENGFPYFRREHQLPGVYVCWRHRRVLYHGCNRCGEYPLRNNSLTLAGECNCDSGIEPLQAVSMEGPPPPSLLWLAEQSAHLLTSLGTQSDPVAKLGRKAVAEATNRLGTVDYRSVANKIMEFFGEDALRLLNIDVFTKGEPASWIRRFFYGDRGQRPTILYLLLVGAYFNSVREFELQRSEEMAEKRSTPRKVINASQPLKKHREILQKLVRDNSDLSRSDFQKLAPGSYDYLIRHDKEFFQSQVKRARATGVSRSKRVDWAALDTTKALELEVYFANEYNKGRKPVFITASSALQSCSIFTKYRADSSRFPKVGEILSKKLEDRDSFHKRRLYWAINEMKRTGTPISANRLRRVADLELKVLHRNREFILSSVHEIGCDVDDRSFLC
ncbi:TnsD family Tn7-like transposition protein [Geomonas propionica]|uniref:TniQ family protein n=1 Tax=Geomonas propionica TaxID=2798582 RepID=A0ABS0YLJ5_9BACT|nr:TnsD family Tn7-like transposition protein [Geomonas propionica]MBJ6798822.1 TniQ family protein [Geomonas propionica]